MPRMRATAKLKNSVTRRSDALAKRKEPQATRPYVPGYKFSAKKPGLLSWKWATARLRKSRQYWIATARPDGAPHLMVIWGVWLADSFWFSTGATSRKARNLDANPKCVIGTDNAAEAVILEGTVEMIALPHAEFEQFAAAYEKKYRWNVREMAQTVHRFRPSVGFGLFEKKFDQTATRWRFR
jgi:Pyridoxamine 5'-phosphate oxidase